MCRSSYLSSSAILVNRKKQLKNISGYFAVCLKFVLISCIQLQLFMCLINGHLAKVVSGAIVCWSCLHGCVNFHIIILFTQLSVFIYFFWLMTARFSITLMILLLFIAAGDVSPLQFKIHFLQIKKAALMILNWKMWRILSFASLMLRYEVRLQIKTQWLSDHMEMSVGISLTEKERFHVAWKQLDDR